MYNPGSLDQRQRPLIPDSDTEHPGRPEARCTVRHPRKLLLAVVMVLATLGVGGYCWSRDDESPLLRPYATATRNYGGAQVVAQRLEEAASALFRVSLEGEVPHCFLSTDVQELTDHVLIQHDGTSPPKHLLNVEVRITNITSSGGRYPTEWFDIPTVAHDCFWMSSVQRQNNLQRWYQRRGPALVVRLETPTDGTVSRAELIDRVLRAGGDAQVAVEASRVENGRGKSSPAVDYGLTSRVSHVVASFETLGGTDRGEESFLQEDAFCLQHFADLQHGLVACEVSQSELSTFLREQKLEL
jgi:hypothetical protein